MSRTSTFYEFSPTTKAKWERLARRVAALAHYDAQADSERLWTKDEVISHIASVLASDGEEMDSRREEMYLERMRMASVFSGPEIPTLDLVPSKENGFGYRWIRDGQIPAGFLGHILAVAGGMPRLCFDYFILMAHDYSLEELMDAIGSVKAMTLLLLAELYVRVHRADELDEDQTSDYLNCISQFKQEVQAKITRAEAEGFNALATGLLLPPPNHS